MSYLPVPDATAAAAVVVVDDDNGVDDDAASGMLSLMSPSSTESDTSGEY